MFLNPTAPIGDNVMYPFLKLGQKLKEMEHKVNTIDMDALENFEAVVFIEFPTFKNKYFRRLIKNKFQNLYLMALESPIIRPDNLDLENHKYFKKIFIWSDELVDNKKYFKLTQPNKMPKNLDFEPSEKNKLCAMIISNKFKSHPQQLYSERIKAIRWFEKNHPEDFNLYGLGWDKYYFHGSFLGINLLRLNRLKFLAKLLKPHYPSWRGSVKSKRETYKKYKFAICYENCRDFPGYITEKIFDCFFAGCVPVYRGASNVTEYIPVNTFIDKRNFKTYDELYKYLKNMPNDEYQGYLTAIKNFLQSDKAYPFSAEYFVETISREILT